MIFLVLACVSGIILAAGPFWAARYFRSRWKMPRGLFLKSGLALLMIEIIHLAAIGNATSIWPSTLDWPAYIQAAVFGLASGLFIELGRFLVLDRMMKKVRSRREGIYFGLGWSGIETALLGFAIVIGILGSQSLLATEDWATRFPEASKTDIEQLKSFQQQANELMQGNPVVALAPLLERVSLTVIEIALTLLILLAFEKGNTSYVWAAVGFRALFAGTLIFAGKFGGMAGEVVFPLYGILAFLMARQIKNSLRET